MSWHTGFVLMMLSIVLCFENGCQSPYRLQRQQLPQTPIFIAIPVNNHVAESVGPLLYDCIIQHFQRRGYKIVADNHQGYTLRTTIDALSIAQRFISQDIILLDKLTELTITCGLYNYNNTLIKEKTFVFETIVPKTQAPLQQDAYTNYHIQQTLKQNLDTIEQAFKPYL